MMQGTMSLKFKQYEPAHISNPLTVWRRIFFF